MDNSKELNEDELLREAKRVADEKIGFLTHLLIFIVVNGMLFFINIFTSWGNFWFIWVAGFWGIGLLIHGISVFIFDSAFGGLRTRFVENELKRLKK